MFKMPLRMYSDSCCFSKTGFHNYNMKMLLHEYTLWIYTEFLLPIRHRSAKPPKCSLLGTGRTHPQGHLPHKSFHKVLLKNKVDQSVMGIHPNVLTFSSPACKCRQRAKWVQMLASGTHLSAPCFIPLKLELGTGSSHHHHSKLNRPNRRRLPLENLSPRKP